MAGPEDNPMDDQPTDRREFVSASFTHEEWEAKQPAGRQAMVKTFKEEAAQTFEEWSSGQNTTMSEHNIAERAWHARDKELTAAAQERMRELSRQEFQEWSEYFLLLDRWHENKGPKYDRPESPSSKRNRAIPLKAALVR